MPAWLNALRYMSWVSCLHEHRCVLCRTPFHPLAQAQEVSEMWLCPVCRPRLPRYTGARCPACGHPVPLQKDTLCWQCLQDPPPWEAYGWYGIYRGDFRDILLEFKFYNGLGLTPFLADMLLEVMRCLPICDCIVPVPSPPRRLRKRGWNQTAELARALSRRTSLPVLATGLRRVKEAERQVLLRASVRAQGPRGSFIADGVMQCRILLLDDIVTTGATARHAAASLIAGGASKVCLLSVARAVR